MKLTKILAGTAALALASAVMFTSCGEIGEINWSSNSSTGTTVLTVNQSNNSETNSEENTYIRGFKLMSFSHESANCVIRIFDQTSSSNDGVAGFAWNVVEGKNSEGTKTYSFFLLGTKYEKGTPKYYLSYFANITEENLSADNFGASTKKTAYDSDDVDTSYEIVIKDFTKISNLSLDSDGTMALCVSVTYNNDANTDDSTPGTQAVSLYTVGEDAETTQSATFDVDKCTKLGEIYTITGSNYGLTKFDQKMGAYANIYWNGTLHATWSYYDVTGNAIPLEFDDSVASPVLFE